VVLLSRAVDNGPIERKIANFSDDRNSLPLQLFWIMAAPGVANVVAVEAVTFVEIKKYIDRIRN
jgi:hypothetical protein